MASAYSYTAIPEGASQTKIANITNQNAWNMQSALNAFNAEEAQKNRDFQASQTATQYQRGVADLKAAGLNPILAANSAAGVASGSQAASAGDAAISTLGQTNGRLVDALTTALASQTSANAMVSAASIQAAAQRYAVDHTETGAIINFLQDFLGDGGDTSDSGASSGSSQVPNFIPGLMSALGVSKNFSKSKTPSKSSSVPGSSVVSGSHNFRSLLKGSSGLLSTGYDLSSYKLAPLQSMKSVISKNNVLGLWRYLYSSGWSISYNQLHSLITSKNFNQNVVVSALPSVLKKHGYRKR